MGALLLTCRILAEAGAGLKLYLMVPGYLFLSILWGVLFWPEAFIYGRGSAWVLTPDRIGSYTASQDDSATILTAEDTGDVAGRVVLETPGFRLFLRAATDLALGVAKSINPESHRPLRFLVSTSRLLGHEMTADTTRALVDWVEGCWKPSMKSDQEFQEAITSRELMPWGNTPVAKALATREMVPGSQTGRGYFVRPNSPLGVYFLSNPGGARAVNCLEYLAAMELDLGNWLFTEKTANGTRLSETFHEDLGMDMQAQVRFIIYREAIKTLERPSPATSLAGAYATLSAAQIGAGAVSGAVSPNPRTGSMGGWLGGLFGGAQAATNQFTGLLATFTSWVGTAMWLSYWAPFIVGIVLQELVGLFPLVLCYAWVAGQQFKPLVIYFLSLLYVLFTPVWFAIIDLAARSAATHAPQSNDPLLSLLNWAPAQTASVVVTVLGIFLVPTIGAGVFFASGWFMIRLFRS